MFEKMLHKDILSYLAKNFLNLNEAAKVSRVSKQFNTFFKSKNVLEEIAKSEINDASINSTSEWLAESFLRGLRGELKIFNNKQEAKTKLLDPLIKKLEHLFYTKKNIKAGFDLMSLYVYGVSYSRFDGRYSHREMIGINSDKGSDLIEELLRIILGIGVEPDKHCEYRASLKEEYTSFLKSNGCTQSKNINFNTYQDYLLNDILQKFAGTKKSIQKL